ncbi:hypothetical protein AMIS_20440 [Actinoplanes missouriensis 431]|uniref:Uncharacterized protein n=1 Tax=Actinoplanes missouriensis (strain ATCC 14538 / DSM 43046 / CBS 188.64 / JCM 3121 / NBRC 102363 / NCIMB 12654 / NRRL B-3342 / UNCC 431) TaxID=512565 RepID=I0H2M7_ACTM4|nr:hypothetical protein [Actinoplanes missouriensis]BAL87264.1 hypothetical protein AMIS_20440 [Actinoplanes missouriensis 431]
MTVTDGTPQRESPPEPDADRVAQALRTQDSFDRAQAAWLIHAAFQSGYELGITEAGGFHAGYRARVDEENATWPPPKVFTLGRWYDQAAERAEADAAARLPRPGDFRGRDTPPAQVAA